MAWGGRKSTFRMACSIRLMSRLIRSSNSEGRGSRPQLASIVPAREIGCPIPPVVLAVEGTGGGFTQCGHPGVRVAW